MGGEARVRTKVLIGIGSVSVVVFLILTMVVGPRYGWSVRREDGRGRAYYQLLGDAPWPARIATGGFGLAIPIGFGLGLLSLKRDQAIARRGKPAGPAKGVGDELDV